MVDSLARFHRSLEGHLAMIAVLRAGDPAAAETAMRAHLRSAQQHLARPS